MNETPSSTIQEAQESLGRALRELRRGAGMTQKELAERAGADDTYISQVETGRRDIRWSTITRLLYALGATPADLSKEIQKQQARPGSKSAVANRKARTD
jgi:transcriptional regulator with XRE-family HTH domain